ncbi:hypothetical protein CONLIGDRAFT_305048 [Coniochaeta ligniaria NRRL 30616]|uniref:Protein EFR3 n=1 Tax=Coniochaeta ligniaria NRRL 30616 TaxID=1408157 RepID=A0A1J7IU29_9PEZI|nr:hypothetical protein CONLIGDRAFT_305048 [Coniochaeta ligniaria NRRL 30616]
MNAIQQRCRPKHQVLVLKCYPRTTKGAVDVKPNSSELSYLLFYAQSRRTKIQKVGTFLEKKTASDVYRMRIGNVQVTLQILTALIEKSPKDLPLIAPCVLKILDQILRSNDITLVESSLPTFEAFCEHHDAASLLADQAYLRQYESIVRQYAALASTRSSPGKVQPSKPVSMRWRNAGLEAIKSVASSDALSSVSGRQYDVIVPMILENLWTDNEDFLEVLLHRSQMEEKVDTSGLLKRRTSIATVRTADTAGDTNPIALSGSALDVDKLAEEDIGVLAMQCLKQIFVVPNRTQIYAATLALLRFIEERVSQGEVVVKTHLNNRTDSGWAIKMFSLVSQWAPVQDRYTILVTTLDNLVKRPLMDENLQQHIVLVAMIGSLLRSDVNLIGLSVMDVLLNLITHMRRLVQMPGDPNSMRRDGPGPGQPDLRSPTALQFAEQAERISSQRKELLERLQHCIGDLATHVYYADQISDMITTILQKLRPSRSGNTANNSPQGEKADANGGPSGSVTSVEDSHLDSLFSLTIAKVAALKAIKSILLVANPKSKMAGNVSLSRNRTPIQVWEGTQWLLRDADGHVRKAYVDAVLTWLDRETTKEDLRARDETVRNHRKPTRELSGINLAKRAASSASANREKPTKTPRSHFLQLLHVAIYDNALQFVDYETDIVLLHVLLAKLVSQLGVNAARYGIPMVFRLQEDIQDADTPIAKVRLGSLCHGYFWVLTEKFNFEGTVVGRAIHNEIVRRRSKHFWVEGVHVPPPLLELVGTPGMARPQPRMPLKEIESEALLPFDDRTSLVECVCIGYQETTVSPPASPAGTPGRSFTHPILGGTMGGIPAVEVEHEIPTQFREMMLGDWSREMAMAAIEAGSKSASLNGSRTGTTGTNNQAARARLAVNGGANGHGHGYGGSPHGSQSNLRPQSSPTGGNLAVQTSKLRKSSVRSNVSPAPSGRSGLGVVTSVDQLKAALSGQLRPATTATTRAGAGAGDEDDSDDSMVSYEMTPSELSFNPAAAGQEGGMPSGLVGLAVDERLVSRERERRASGPLTSHPPDGEAEVVEEVPPVPPLPRELGEPALQSATLPRPSTGRKGLRSRGGDSVLSASWAAVPGEDGVKANGKAVNMDLDLLLRAIDAKAEAGGLGGVGRPPY